MDRSQVHMAVAVAVALEEDEVRLIRFELPAEPARLIEQGAVNARWERRWAYRLAVIAWLPLGFDLGVLTIGLSSGNTLTITTGVVALLGALATVVVSLRRLRRGPHRPTPPVRAGEG